jgi:hypothetical protein
MATYIPAPACPLGYRLVPDEHINAIEHALMRRIRELESLLPDPLPEGLVYTELQAQRNAQIAALRAINPTLAALWTGEAPT